jgi:hypothetical protein
MISIWKKIIFAGFLLGSLSSCFSHNYIIQKGKATSQEEIVHLRLFTLFGILPIYNDINQETVCPNKKIRSINTHDSFFNGLVCGATLFIFCPATVGITCLD